MATADCNWVMGVAMEAMRNPDAIEVADLADDEHPSSEWARIQTAYLRSLLKSNNEEAHALFYEHVVEKWLSCDKQNVLVNAASEAAHFLRPAKSLR